MNVLVTGGAGFIGSVVTAQLVEAGHKVTVYDNLSKGKPAAVASDAELVVGDVSDRNLLCSVVRQRKIEAVMHFAAYIEAGESMRCPEQFFRNNTANSFGLLEVILENRIPRFVFSSTAALYGNPERTPIAETDPLSPTNAYGESKLLVERVLDWYHRIHGLSYASLRYFNAAGATTELGEVHDPESHLIPLILQVPMGKRAEISIFGTDYSTPDGTCIRDYIHVTDLASAHLLALDALAGSPSPAQLIYNLGNGRGFSVREVIDVARRVTGHSIPAREVARREGDPAVLVASSDKIRRELQWQPKYPELENIIASSWEWFQRHPNGYVE